LTRRSTLYPDTDGNLYKPHFQCTGVFTMDLKNQLGHSHDIGVKVGLIFQKRMKAAMEHFSQRAAGALKTDGPESLTRALAMSNPVNASSYAVDAIQRAILFWDTLRQRGNNFVERNASGFSPLLHFDYETILDGRALERPVNYALLRITPPEGVTIDPGKRPYLIIDPRAGHGPGVGGFKDDSQVGVALRAGHPVYFVIFYRDPEPGQTLLDVCMAEQQFVKKVRALHPDSAKPAIIGNCQGGWAAMMLASSDPDDSGPVIVVGAPMSYWGGAWDESQANNPMRYAGGILGGTWLSSLTADLGNGKFDGAYLVQNFEYLNPANTYWDKYYNLYRNIETQAPRFLEFERWWGSYYLMNREEIEWITRNLFVGNKLWSGEVRVASGKALDLRAIKSPIILFASMGDNITPPQQAFNWVADTYGSTEEIKARGQVIVGLTHQDVGHLGIFVSGKVAKKEHAQIISALEEIELLPPGLYGMEITERKGDGDRMEYSVEFREHRLEEVLARLNRFERIDEKPFEAVTAISDFNQRAYELFAQPIVQEMSGELSASLLREFHPLRFQNWAMSFVNPCLSWLDPAAQAVKANRRPVHESNPILEMEKAGSDMISASLDLYRDIRDAVSEATFFSIYANMFSLLLADKQKEDKRRVEAVVDPHELPSVMSALASIKEGGYAEAFARIDGLLAPKGETLSMSQLVLRKELAESYAELLPRQPLEQWRRIRGEQEIITRYEPELALDTLPDLLSSRAERERMLTLLDKLMSDSRIQKAKPSPEQLAMYNRIHKILSDGGKPAPAREHRPAAIAQS
jgi:pimeloyl-ACP methyl ester carboxylesterase